LYLRGEEQVVRRAQKLSKTKLWLTVKTVEESLRGRLAQINSSKDDIDKLKALFLALNTTVTTLARYQTLPFDDKAAAIFKGFPSKAKRISANDRLIASIALANDYILVTANTKHFKELLPENQLQDWTRDDSPSMIQ
jgi:predicted nucleic acid-binding protein